MVLKPIKHKSMKRDFLPVSCWAAEDIPSNKIIEANPANMSNAELLSIILGTGSDKETSVDLARRILQSCNNDLSELSKKSAKQLTYMRGVGKQKAAKIMAALELGKRRQSQMANVKPEISSAVRIYNNMHPIMQDLDVEEFWCLFMNHNYKLIRKFRLSIGGLTETCVDIRIVIREAVMSNATVLAVCHNHPSGSLTPSKYDDVLTTSIKNACDIMRIYFLDHVIITDGAYYSYHEQGRI